MDQERWSSALAKQHSGKKVNSRMDRSPPEVNRYKHDMEQAEAMRGQSRQRAVVAVEKDVQLGLRGLEEADNLHHRGDLDTALKLYGQSIELLLRCLKNSSSSKPTFDQEVVSARVTVALSDAERIKERLQQKKSPQQASQPSGESPKSAWASLSSSLASALQQSPEKKEGAVIVRASKKASQAAATAVPRRRTSLDYDNDPYVQTVKSDLYVDPSELQSISWNDVCGLEHAKRSLQESAILPLIRPDLYTGLRKPQNILLYGPPGTGKTLLVRAVAHESQCLLFACTASALTSKWHGEGEKLVRTLFRVAHDVAPSIIFVDEMDALLSSRKADEHEASRRFKTEFMIQMDGLKQSDEGNVLVVACTNCPWDVDDAVMRRFPRRIYVPLPDAEARRGLLKALLKKAGPHNLTSRDVDSFVQRTEGFSCSDITSIASEAAFEPLRSLGGIDAIRGVRPQDVRKISVRDFDAAIKHSSKSVTPTLLAKYKQWEKQQGS